MISFVEGQDLSVPTASLKSLTKSLNRDASLVLPLAANSPRVMPAAHQGQGLTEASWRFVFTYMSMLVSVPDEGSVKFSQKLIEKIGRDSQALLKTREVPQLAGGNKSAGALLTAVANLSLHDCLRYDKREEVRRQLGLSVVIESFCFLIVGQESCITNEALLTLWKHYFDGDASGRFSFFALEAILFSARGIRCRSIVNSLLPKAKAFIASVAKNEDQGLLSVALYCSSFRNAGNIEILRKAGIVGSIRENPAQCCTLLDACLVGNHNAVEMILYENVNGAPPIEAVKISVEKKFPKCVDALITDDEVTKQFLLQAQGILQEAAPQEFDAQKKSVGDLVARH
ncbi:Hypothetical protein, putative [Bodo saltans]|uniref:Uncharacterized protein n=1 Tax=Bodo saltans TaxID=75058 RepID=A0A0S4JBR4_BODSA|nr:Hypothetical protein, putative [Bodo saltans]|eukprot:CUG86624.1 Hypothetical protein, putative [Bodo saltans]